MASVSPVIEKHHLNRSPFPTSSQTRDLLKTKEASLRAGFLPSDPFIQSLDEIILSRIQQVGKAQYVSEMLGSLWKVPAGDCRFYYMAGLEIELPEEYKQKPCGQYIVARFQWNSLPFKVEGGGKVRYL